MILYDLLCSNEHRFESWFRDSAAYDSMAAAGAVECPVCGDTKVRKALMAPAIGRKGATRAATPATEAAAAAGAAAQPPAPAAAATAMMAGDHGKAAETVRKLAEALGQLQKAVQDNCDYVGDRFAEEARRIHYGETETRGIYGETTREEAEALREEGVAFATIPWRRPVS
ncbi:DUF1178 family protein [Caenispirillum bisanense]|uniref:DUF1178 family protein n=1 Tax=Caenispirillum bisanense TaxID=414052 RepID=UPI0031CFD550